MGVAQIAFSKEGMRPFSDGIKGSSLHLLLFVQVERVTSLSSKCHSMLKDSAFWECSDRLGYGKVAPVQ